MSYKIYINDIHHTIRGPTPRTPLQYLWMLGIMICNTHMMGGSRSTFSACDHIIFSAISTTSRSAITCHTYSYVRDTGLHLCTSTPLEYGYHPDILIRHTSILNNSRGLIGTDRRMEGLCPVVLHGTFEQLLIVTFNNLY